MVKKRNLGKGFGGRKQQPKRENLVVGTIKAVVKLWKFLPPTAIAPFNLLLASACSILVVMIGMRFGDTKYATPLSPVVLFPTLLGALGGAIWKFRSKKSFQEIGKDIVANYGDKRWTATLIILGVVFVLTLHVVSQPTCQVPSFLNAMSEVC